MIHRISGTFAAGSIRPISHFASKSTPRKTESRARSSHMAKGCVSLTRAQILSPKAGHFGARPCASMRLHQAACCNAKGQRACRSTAVLKESNIALARSFEPWPWPSHCIVSGACANKSYSGL